MTSADVPSPWSEYDLTDPHRVALRALLRYVSPPPGGEGGGGPGRLVQGVVQPPGRPDTTRVVLWDGRDLGTSLAYDFPPAGRYDCNVPWSDIAGVLRQLAAAGPASTDATSVDGLGIPVVDVRAETFRFQDEPSYDLTDALHAVVRGLGPQDPYCAAVYDFTHG
ncbi:hypothetical protein [Streptomyces sp. NPDC059874]|uniref:hypothetical protein n=1 Tax=Streptomyces sp. NPDC059874 TaxID=3346983 RepID=UPI00365376F5